MPVVSVVSKRAGGAATLPHRHGQDNTAGARHANGERADWRLTRGGRGGGAYLAPSTGFPLRWKVVNLDRLDRAGQREAEDARVEVQLTIERAFDVLGLAEAVALTREFEVSDGDAALAQDGDHLLRLAGQHDLVVEALREIDGTRHLIGEVDGRALVVGLPR